MQRKIESIYSTSPVQRALLLGSEQSGQRRSNIEQIVVKLSGDCDFSTFCKACQYLVSQHSVFRTAFVWTDSGESYQVVSREVTLEVDFEDWTSLSEPRIAELLETMIAVDKAASFDLTKAPLLRVKLLRLDARKSIFIWTHHHALLDGWCLPMLFRELFTAYAAFSNGEQPEPYPRRPYQDYIQWLLQQDSKRAESFWKTTLAGFEIFTTIRGYERFINGNGPSSGAYGDATFRLSSETTARLQAACQKMRITLNTAVQAAWALLLSLYSGQKDLLFGATVSGRPPSVAGVEEMIGPFFNTIPVRAQVVGNMSLHAWLAEIQHKHVQARQYEHVSTAQLCEWIGWPAGASMFEALLVFQNYPSDPFDISDRLGALRVDEIVSPVRSSYPLTLSISVATHLELALAYASSRFRRIDVVRMLKLMADYLMAIADSRPDQRVRDLQYLDEAHHSRGAPEVKSSPEARPSWRGFNAGAGRAVADLRCNGTDVVILNEDKHPVPAGVVGELYASRERFAGLCSNRPDAANDFLEAIALGSGTSSTVYPTRVLAKADDDGAIEVVGTLDRLAQLGRRRLNLHQIESILLEHPDVAEGTVVVSQGILICHVVARDPSMRLDVRGIRAFLRFHLPEYMVPGDFVQLASLPKDTGGAVDGRALADMPTSSGRTETATEEIIGAIWAQLTGTRAPSVNHNLLQLCGNSLVAAQMISRIASIFGIPLHVSVFFEHSTIAALADKVNLHRRQTQATLPLTPSNKSQEAYPLSYAQERLWFLDQLSPGNCSYNVPLAFRISGITDCHAMGHAVAALIARHETLRSTFAGVRGVPWQVVNNTSNGCLALADLTCIDKAERQEYAAKDLRLLATEPLNLESGPLFRTVLVRVAADEHYLLFNIHHIVFDGWSTGILIRELVELYEAYVVGRPPELPALRIQYKDFALWQRQVFEAGGYQPEIAYWRRQLLPEPTFILATDYPRPRVRSYSGASHRFECGQEASTNVEALRKSEGATTFMILLSAFQVLLCASTSARDVIVATDVANREEPELEHVVGFFVNQVVLRGDLSGNPTFRELIARNRATTLAAYDHQRLPFSKLVEVIRPTRAVGQQPLFQVLFVLQNMPRKIPVLGSGLTIEALALDLPFSNFDLALFMNDSVERLAGLWVFNTDLFAATTIDRLALGFVTLLEHAVRHADTPLEALISLAREQHTASKGTVA